MPTLLLRASIYSIYLQQNICRALSITCIWSRRSAAPQLQTLPQHLVYHVDELQLWALNTHNERRLGTALHTNVSVAVNKRSLKNWWIIRLDRRKNSTANSTHHYRCHYSWNFCLYVPFSSARAHTHTPCADSAGDRMMVTLSDHTVRWHTLTTEDKFLLEILKFHGNLWWWVTAFSWVLLKRIFCNLYFTSLFYVALSTLTTFTDGYMLFYMVYIFEFFHMFCSLCRDFISGSFK